MIVGLGCDIINVERLLKSTLDLVHFADRILGANEQTEISDQTNGKVISKQKYACILAKHFAAKEAFVKALGTGFRFNIYLKDIEVLHNKLGQPILRINGNAREILQENHKNARLHITLSDDFPYAQAVVIIETD